MANLGESMEKIFVAIASYRDTECQWTVKDLFEAANFPDRVNVGICWQFDAEEDQACFLESCPRPEQVQRVNVALEDARGACWAKARALSLATDEAYILLIDSHMRFAKGWDQQMISMLADTGNPRSFLSTYPAGYEPPDKRNYSTPRLAPVKFFDRVMSQNSLLLDMPEPMPSYLVAGGYLFGHRAMFDEVPYDPYIYFIGEEIAHAARYFTHGWIGYTPNRCVIHHYYARKTAAKHWDDGKETWPKLNLASYKRVRHLLGVETTSDHNALAEIEKYGLGKQKTLADFQAAIGVNFNAEVIDRSRQESVANILAAVADPKPPLSTHEVGNLGTYACRHGHLLLPRHDAYIGKSLIAYGDWLDGLNAIFRYLIEPGSVVVEVGAGFGAHTVPLSRQAGCEGTVFAFEQSRKMADLLHANIVINSLENVEVMQLRVGRIPGAVLINEPAFDGTGNFGMIAHKPVTHPTRRTVPIVQLDMQNLGHVGFLFIDSPGGSSEVIEGSTHLLASHAPSVVTNADNPTDAASTAELLNKHGYKLWWSFVPFYSSRNFLRNKENAFGTLLGKCLVAVPDQRDMSHLGLVRAIGSAANPDTALDIWKELTIRNL